MRQIYFFRNNWNSQCVKLNHESSHLWKENLRTIENHSQIDMINYLFFCYFLFQLPATKARYIFPVTLNTVDRVDPVGFGFVEQSTIEGVFGIDWKAQANGTNGEHWISNDNMREVSRLHDWWLRMPCETLMPIVKFFRFHSIRKRKWTDELGSFHVCLSIIALRKICECWSSLADSWSFHNKWFPTWEHIFVYYFLATKEWMHSSNHPKIRDQGFDEIRFCICLYVYASQDRRSKQMDWFRRNLVCECT